MKSIIVLIILTFFAGTITAQKTFVYQDSNFIYRLPTDSSLSGDSMNYDCSVKSIVVLRRSDSKLVQTIIPADNNFFCSLPQSQVLIIEDINFDGLNDIRIIQFIPAAPNIPYYYWIFDNRTKKFRRDTALEAITSPDFNHNKKIITSFWRASCCDHGLSVYKFINRKPVLIEETEVAQDLTDEKKYITTIKKRVNGKMRVIKKTVKKETGND